MKFLNTIALLGLTTLSIGGCSKNVNHTQLLDHASLNWFHNTIFCIIKIKKN